MLFAHGPFGVLSSLLFRRGSALNAIKKQEWAAIVLAFFGGIFPDIDILYVLFIDASRWHRAYFTATPFPYLLFFLILGSVLYFFKKKKAFRLLSIFTVATMSHILTDMILGKVMVFYPFSARFYGIRGLEVGWINSNIFFINFFLEGILSTLFLYLLIVWCAKKKEVRFALTSLLVLAFGIGVVMLVQVQLHMYSSPDDVGLGDWDDDTIINFADTDMDGDGLENLLDPDADGDGFPNTAEILVNAERFEGGWYDPTEGGFGQIPSRMGLLVNSDGPRQLYGTVGIFFKQAMVEDYSVAPEVFTMASRERSFDRDPENLRAWFAYRGFLIDRTWTVGDRLYIGDILFFESGRVATVVNFSSSAEPLVLDIAPDRPIQKQPLQAVIDHEGSVEAWAHLLPSSLQ